MIWVLMSYRSLRFHNNAEEPPGAAALRLFCRDLCAPGRNTRRLVWSFFPSSCLYTRLSSLPPWFSFQPFSAVTLCWDDPYWSPLGAGWGCFGCSGMAGKCENSLAGQDCCGAICDELCLVSSSNLTTELNNNFKMLYN